MSTPFSLVFERFQNKIQDYTIDQLYKQSVDIYESYLIVFLKSALTKFFGCKINLSDRDDAAKIFNSNLTEKEQEILACLMVVEWAEKETNNIMDMRLALSNSDFKRYAESQNLKEKRDLLQMHVERADRLMIEYSLENFDFKVQ